MKTKIDQARIEMSRLLVRLGRAKKCYDESTGSWDNASILYGVIGVYRDTRRKCQKFIEVRTYDNVARKELNQTIFGGKI